MKWGKDPEKRTKFGVWVDQRGIFQVEVTKASGLSNQIISTLCNKKTINRNIALLSC
jgi:hypothetical protein